LLVKHAVGIFHSLTRQTNLLLPEIPWTQISIIFRCKQLAPCKLQSSNNNTWSLANLRATPSWLRKAMTSDWVVYAI